MKTENYKPPYVNRVWLSGRVVGKPRLAFSSNQTPYVKWTIRTMTTFRLPGTERTRVNWHFVQCVAFGKVAKHAKAICQNDEFVMVDGYIESFLAKKEDGTERNVSRVRAYSIGLLGHTYRPGTASANSGKCSDNEDQTREEEKEEDQYPEDATIVDGDGDLPF